MRSRVTTSLLYSLIAAIGLFGARGLQAAPQTIILIRHADKNIPLDGSDNLNSRGLNRAMNLARVIPQCFGKPSRIFTYPFSTTTSKHARSYQTAVPLGVKTSVRIELNYSSDPQSNIDPNNFEIGEMIKGLSHAKHPLVVVVWEHESIPELARGLGTPGVKPIAYDNFNNLYLFEFQANEATPQLKILSQDQFFTNGCIETTPGINPN